MSTESRTTVSGGRGYTIDQVVVSDENGNVISELYELRRPDGRLFGAYPSFYAADAALDVEISNLPPIYLD